MRISRAVVVLALALGLPVAAAFAATGDTLLLVRATGTGALGTDAIASKPAVSRDGRFVAFESDSPRLHRDDRDALTDAFVLDRRDGSLTLVSRASGRRGVKGDESSGDTSISDDGRYVAFDGARDIGGVTEYPNATLYVRDLRRHRTRLISRASGAGALANGASSAPKISGNGRVVVFSSEATNLDPADRSVKEDVYLRDLRTGRTSLVSRKPGSSGRRGNQSSERPSISDDGRYVVFDSRANNLSRADTDHRRDVFLRDLRTGRTHLVTWTSTGTASHPVISGNGRFVAFHYKFANDLDPADTDRKSDIYVIDLETGESEVVSRTVFNVYEQAAISDDGRLVAFTSTAADLDPADRDTEPDVYLHDRSTGATRLVSRASGDGPKAAGGSNLFSGDPALAGDGSLVAFVSSAPNLHPDDRDDEWDVFGRELAP